MIRLLKNDAITSKDIELNNMPFMHADLQFTNGTLFGADATYNPYWVPVYYVTNSHILQILGNQTKNRPP